VLARELVDELVRRLFRSWNIQHAQTVPEANDRLTTIGDLRLAILDLELPDRGSRGKSNSEQLRLKFELIASLRRRQPTPPVVVLSDDCPAEVVNAAQLAEAQLVAKSGCRENLMRLAERLDTAEQIGDWGNAHFLDWLRDGRGLTERQLDVAAFALVLVPRVQIGERLGLSENTVKRHLRDLLRKTGARTMRELVDLARKFNEQ
jgi:DNA-binding NarL/FixJ family response regulator